MADIIITQDPTKPGVLKGNGPTLTAAGDLLLTSLDVTGAINGQAIVLTAGDWAPGNVASSDTASNLGGGAGVFSSKVAADFQFKSLVAGSNVSITPAATTITIASTASGPFSASFTSAQQVITAAGSLTLAHGLAGSPTLVQARRVCITGENNYSAGDELIEDSGMQTAINQGLSIVPTATDLVIRFGSAAITFQGLDKTTGNSANFTNANWGIVFRAWR